MPPGYLRSECGRRTGRWRWKVDGWHSCKPPTSPIQTPRGPAGVGSTVPGGDRLKFNLLDKIESLDDDRIVAVKHVTLAEEYLADHFPTFPVLPGVLMLEAMTQAASWLLHRRTGFGKSIAVLKEARNVKYGQFVAPGDWLRVDVSWLKTVGELDDVAGATFKAAGSVSGGDPAISARLELAYFNLGDKNPALAAADARLVEHTRRRWDVLASGLNTAAAAAL